MSMITMTKADEDALFSLQGDHPATVGEKIKWKRFQ